MHIKTLQSFDKSYKYIFKGPISSASNPPRQNQADSQPRPQQNTQAQAPGNRRTQTKPQRPKQQKTQTRPNTQNKKDPWPQQTQGQGNFNQVKK